MRNTRMAASAILSTLHLTSMIAAGLIVTISGAAKTNTGNPTKDAIRQQDLQSISKSTLGVRVMSSKHLLLLSVNENIVVNVSTTDAEIATSTSDLSRWDFTSGIHFIVLHPANGRLLMHKVIMTTEFGASQELPTLLLSLTPGRILVIATKNDAATNLTPMSRDLLTTLGISSASRLHFRESLAWVGTFRGQVWGEAGTPKQLTGDTWSPPICLDVSVPKIQEEIPCFQVDDPREAARAAFCSQYEGYGELCSCDDPSPLSYQSTELEDSIIRDVPLIIVAGNRPTYLYRSLVTVLGQPGSVLERILVVIDGHHREVTQLLSLLQVSYKEHVAKGVTPSARISDHYRYTISAAFTLFPKASKTILLEEDLLAAPSFFSFFNQTSWLLDVDPSLWCISSWNDLSSLHIAHDPHLLRRVETLPGLGWMVTRTVAQELLQVWPSREKGHDWDMWARGPGIMGGRECVVPDVGRTFHVGLTGAHAPGLLHAAFFAARPVPTQHVIQLRDVHRMVENEYEKMLHDKLANDPLVLDTTLSPCHLNYLPRNLTDRPVVIYIDTRTFIDYLAWKWLAKCLGLWDMDTRASHRGLYHFYFYKTEVFIVGYPFSDYSYLKPPWIKPLTVKNGKDLQKLDKIATTNRSRFRRPELEWLLPYLELSHPSALSVSSLS